MRAKQPQESPTTYKILEDPIRLLISVAWPINSLKGLVSRIHSVLLLWLHAECYPRIISDMQCWGVWSICLLDRKCLKQYHQYSATHPLFVATFHAFGCSEEMKTIIALLPSHVWHHPHPRRDQKKAWLPSVRQSKTPANSEPNPKRVLLWSLQKFT